MVDVEDGGMYMLVHFVFLCLLREWDCRQSSLFYFIKKKYKKKKGMKRILYCVYGSF